ncbi:MAG TPA: NAD+ synthase [Rectinemataceae bacterium]|nr:NAD+ synthase [Rectinemataceae bacterium]
MIVALAQMNNVIGDFDGNRERILAFVRRACAAGDERGQGRSREQGQDYGPAVRGLDRRPELIVFPELAICGYPPMDLLDQDSFVEDSLASLRRLQRELPMGVAVAVGLVDRNRSGQGRPLLNSISVIKDGEIVFSQAKTLLPTYDVFDEARYFEPARERRVFELGGRRIGFAICEDIWWEEPPVPGLRYPVDPVKDLLDAGADLLIVPSASPFHVGKLELRIRLSRNAAREGGVPLLYCNLLGANDSLVFDGRSFAMDAEGGILALSGWDEEILSVDVPQPLRSARPGRDSLAPRLDPPPEPTPAATAVEDRWEEMERALVLGVRDYMRKCGFQKACVGLSGGIDSAVVALLAARAVGSENVTCISMPSRYSSAGSVSDSVELCRNLGLKLESLPIEEPFSAFLKTLEGSFAGRPPDCTEENLQARIRGDLLMAWSNKFGSLLLTTGNKSELATGYCTLYGDMCGALAPIGDLLKTEVFALCRSINERARRRGETPPIPEAILTKPPSAELRPNQVDQDSLPPYELLDEVLDLYILRNLDLEEIVAEGYDSALVQRIVAMVARSEYKRRQAAPVIKVSPRAFGTGRRIPIARVVHEARVARGRGILGAS